MTAPHFAGSGDFSTTDVSWLSSWRLQPQSESHWQVFLEKYFPYIKRRVGKYFLRIQDGEDLQQEILAKVLLNIHSVARPRTGSFRGWLKRVISCAICDWFEDAKKRRAIPLLDPSLIRHVAQEAADEIGEDHYRELMRLAILQVRFDLKPTTWEMFEQAKIQKKPAAEVAKVHRVSVLTVYDANRRVMERLREIIESMDQLDES